MNTGRRDRFPATTAGKCASGTGQSPVNSDFGCENPTSSHAPLVGVPFDEVLLWCMVALSPFQDTVLQKSALALIAASPAVFPLLGLLILHMARRFMRMDFSFRPFAVIAAGYATVLSLLHLVSLSHGVALLEWRSLRGSSILAILIFFAIFGVDYPNTRGLRLALYLAMAITAVGIVIGTVFGPNAVPLLQATPSLTGRPSGFSTEASTLSVQIVCVGTLAVHFCRRKWHKVSAAILTCALLVYSQSKGGLISLLLCVVVIAIVKTRSSLTMKVVAAVVVIPVLYAGSLLLISMFGTIIEANETSSIATRLSMAVFALIAVAHNPTGVGFTGFLPAIRHYLPNAMEIVQSWFPVPLAFVEVKSYLEPPYRDADCKTFFFNYLVFFGIPFAIVFFRFAFGLLRRLFNSGCDSIFVGLLFCLLSLMTYYSTMNAYTMPIFFGIALCEVKRIENPLRMH